MDKLKSYKIATLILSVLVIIEAIFILRLLTVKPKKIPALPVVIKGKIAIVIDDWGYNLNNLAVLGEIKYPLTVSVLPNINYSQRVARELHKRGIEVILHLPMEPYEKYRLEQNTIMTSMDGPTIKSILEKDLANVSYAIGVSNHMGSKATEDLKIMEVIFKELKKRKLYFLDSFVSSGSVCPMLAAQMHLAFAERDIFLDNEENPNYIKRQIYKLKTKARTFGEAIGIGHDRKVTLEVLREVMPDLEKEGYRFIFVSGLVR
jgi:hypothetical protein